jgi:hypothetical protein
LIVAAKMRCHYLLRQANSIVKKDPAPGSVIELKILFHANAATIIARTITVANSSNVLHKTGKISDLGCANDGAKRCVAKGLNMVAARVCGF